MKSIFRVLLLAFLFFSAVSCVKELLFEDEGGLVERTYVVCISDQDEESRAFLKDGVTPVWEEGEKVSVYDPIKSQACTFTVQSVESGKARITGMISDGEFAFSAVYPASAVKSWTDINTVEYNISEEQVIESGSYVDQSSLVSRAYSSNPAGKIVFNNEVSLLKFKVAVDGISTVRIALLKKGAAQLNYSVQASFEKDKYYYAAVKPDTYDAGITAACVTDFGDKWTKISTNSLKAEISGIKSLGIVSDGTASVDYEITGEKTIQDLDAFLDDTGLLDNLSSSLKSLVNLGKALVFQWHSDMMHAYVFEHKSAGPLGDPVTLSGIVYIPHSAVSGGEKLNGVVIVNHASIANDSGRPSNSDDAEAVLAWKGYAVVLSDYCGFGADAEHPQAYLNPDVTARGNFDAYKVALQIMKDKGVKYGTKLYNVGYSQGGFCGMANLKYLSEHPELGISFTKSFLGGGPYDLKATWEAYLSNKYPGANAYAPFTIVSINECERLGIPYNKLFKEPLLSNYQEWILSKKYSMNQLHRYLATDNIANVLTDEVLTASTATCKAFVDVSESYSLSSGWKPTKDGKIYIYHSTEDDLVPYANFTSIKDYLKSVAADCDISFDDGDDGGHMDAVTEWAKILILNW